jgi:hypothetical protein
MESRMSRIEAILPTLARKEDLALLDGKLSEKISNLEIKLSALDGKLTALIHKEIAAASWRMIIWATGVITVSFGGAFFIARFIN